MPPRYSWRGGDLRLSSRSSDGIWPWGSTYWFAFSNVFLTDSTLVDGVWDTFGSSSFRVHCFFGFLEMVGMVGFFPKKNVGQLGPGVCFSIFWSLFNNIPWQNVCRQASNRLGPLVNLRLRHWKKSAYAAATMKWRRCAHPPVLLTQPLATGAPPLCAMEPSNRQLGDVGTGWWPLTMTSKLATQRLSDFFNEEKKCECYGWQDSCWGLQWSQMPYNRIYTLLWQILSAQLIDKLQIYPIICQVCFSFGWASGWLSVRTYP